jgi:hypothetical protein
MPARHTREAPKTFRGKYSEVDIFLRTYDKLLKKYNVTDSQEKCELILEYCSTEVTEFIKSLKHFKDHNWTNLRDAIWKYYDAEKVSQRYHPSDLTTFARKCSGKAIQSMEEWKKYYRKYNAIYGNMGTSSLTENEKNGYFWLSIHRSLRDELLPQINIQDPTRNKRNAPSIDQVCSAAEEYFQRDQFPANLLDAKGFGLKGLRSYDSDSSSSDSDSDSSTDSSDSTFDTEDERKWKKKLKEKLHKKRERKEEKARREPKKIRTPDPDCDISARERARTTKVDKGTEEVAELIQN